MTFPEMMFYAEAEGLLPTRAGRINAVITEIKNFPGFTLEFLDFEKILKNHNLCYKDLTNQELRYINASIQ